MKGQDDAYRRAGALIAAGRLPEAEHALGQILQREPSHVDAMHALAGLHRRRNSLPEAVRLLNAVLNLQPGRAAAWYDMGVTCWSANRPDMALVAFERAEALSPQHADIPYNLGILLRSLGRPEDALARFGRAISLRPNDADAHYNRGLVYQECGRLDDALADYDSAIAFRPQHADAENNRGLVLCKLHRPLEALASYDRALLARPQWAEALNNRGLALHQLGRLAEALDSVERAAALQPDYAEAHNSRGMILLALRRPADALACFDRALQLKPGYGEVYSNRGVALMALSRTGELAADVLPVSGRNDDAAGPASGEAVSRSQGLVADALASYDRAIALRPDYAQAYCNRGDAFKEIMRLEDALADYGRAIRIDPDTPDGQGLWLHTAMHLCHWDGFDNAQARLLAALDDGKRVSAPFALLALAATPEQQLRCARTLVEEEYPPIPDAGTAWPRCADGPLRIGYFSADFHNHATGQLMAGMFERHDRSRFQIFGFSFGPPARDAMRERLARAFDRFLEVGTLADTEIIALSRELGIDIAVDLKGYTKDCRPGIFRGRAAPVQVSYLGFPGTSGASYIDYLIADGTVIPPGEERHYSEKIVRLPGSYQINDSTKQIAGECPSREAAGLPTEGFVYCCFNNNYKITPDIFDLWMGLLRDVPGSVLWLLEGSATAARNLRKEAQRRGVDGTRLVFAQRVELEAHLVRHQLADLFLDTFPCNAHTTASDALWAGLPVLTCPGRTFASRVGASLVKAAGLIELIAESPDDYRKRALKLAHAPDELAAIRCRLAENRLSCALFDTGKTTREIEAAYLEIWLRHASRLAPEAFDIHRNPSTTT